EVDVELPEHVTLVRLPGLYMDEKFTTLMAEDTAQSVASVQRRRKDILLSQLEQHRPDIFMIELYPFGRSVFGFELEPLLEWIRQGRFGDIKVVCSLRDILVEKRKQEFYEERVINSLHSYFHLLLVHSDEQLLTLDETFSRMGDIRIPTVYTGFVGPKADPAAGRKLRQELGIGPDDKLIVVSAGGGRSGYALLDCVLDTYPILSQKNPTRIEMFAGPFREPEEFKRLAAKAVNGIRVRYYTKRFLDYLSAADLSVSLAGYNTCMNIMAAGVPALIFPYAKQQEQPLRVAKLNTFIPMKALRDKDIEPAALSRYIQDMLLEPRTARQVPINMDGAENTAQYLVTWLDR
ncbi:MAG: glycosyltransferase, partial [Desulfobacterales bacterium]|nr:glycosyltransferase [Desulfobacterales bacterium]